MMNMLHHRPATLPGANNLLIALSFTTLATFLTWVMTTRTVWLVVTFTSFDRRSLTLVILSSSVNLSMHAPITMYVLTIQSHFHLDYNKRYSSRIGLD